MGESKFFNLYSVYADIYAAIDAVSSGKRRSASPLDVDAVVDRLAQESSEELPPGELRAAVMQAAAALGLSIEEPPLRRLGRNGARADGATH